MKRFCILTVFGLCCLSCLGQTPAIVTPDSLNAVYEREAIHLSGWGMYQKGGSFYSNGFVYANLKYELKRSADATVMFHKGMRLNLTAAGMLAGGATAVYVAISEPFGFIGGNFLAMANKALGFSGLIGIVGSTFVFSIADFKIRKAVNLFNRDILINAATRR